LRPQVFSGEADTAYGAMRWQRTLENYFLPKTTYSYYLATAVCDPGEKSSAPSECLWMERKCHFCGNARKDTFPVFAYLSRKSGTSSYADESTAILVCYFANETQWWQGKGVCLSNLSL